MLLLAIQQYTNMENNSKKILVLSLMLVLTLSMSFIKKDTAEVEASLSKVTETSSLVEKSEKSADVKELIYKVQKLDENFSKLRENLNNDEHIKSLVTK